MLNDVLAYKQDSEVKLWTRPTLGWKQECEQSGVTRQDVFKELKDPVEAPFALLVCVFFVIIALIIECGSYCTIPWHEMEGKMIVTGVTSLILTLNILLCNSSIMTMESNKEKIVALGKLNGCIDEYTAIPVDELHVELDTCIRSIDSLVF